MYGESMGVAVWVVFGLAALFMLGAALIHYWVMLLIVIGALAVAVIALAGIAIVHENRSYGWPWWTL